MTTDHGHHHGAGEHNPEVDHEHSDVNVRSILSFGAGLFVIAAVCAVIILIMFRILERQAAANDPQLSPLSAPTGRVPPEPALQTNEPAYLAKFHAQEEKTLDGYGWVNQAGGVAHIPIAEAKKLLAERGLPARATATDPLEGTHAPAMGESSSGRRIPVRVAAGTAAAPPAAAPAPATHPAEEPVKK